VLQAIAAARLGAAVTLYGRVGADPFGDEVLAVAQNSGVNVSPVERLTGEATGTSLILAGSDRQALAAHAPGANGKVDENYIARFLSPIQDADAVLLDLGIPMATATALLRALPPTRPIVILHPIPPHDSSQLPWPRVDFLVGSREEFAGRSGWASGAEEAARAGQPFLDLGVRNLLVTSGRDGAYLVEKAGATRFPSHDVPLADPSGAGAAFAAALAVKLAAGRGPYEAVGYANAAAALTVTRPGAISSLPTALDVQAFLSRPPLHPGPAAA
jgi:ribokinase